MYGPQSCRNWLLTALLINQIGCSDAKCRSNKADLKPPSTYQIDNKPQTQKQLLHLLNGYICNNAAGRPSGISQENFKLVRRDNGEQEVAVAVNKDVEAFFHRTVDASGDDQNACGSATSDIIEKCVSPPDSVAGEANGPKGALFYEGGFRKLDSKAGIHAPFGAGVAGIAAGGAAAAAAAGAAGAAGTGGAGGSGGTAGGGGGAGTGASGTDNGDKPTSSDSSKPSTCAQIRLPKVNIDELDDRLSKPEPTLRFDPFKKSDPKKRSEPSILQERGLTPPRVRSYPPLLENSHSEHGLQRRQRTSEQTFQCRGSANLRWTFPGYPSTSIDGPAPQGIPPSNFYWGPSQNLLHDGPCVGVHLQRFDAPQGAQGYATEHVFELHFVRTFLNFVNHQYPGWSSSPGKSCPNIFGAFMSALPANNGDSGIQSLASSLSCQGGSICPEDRASEFFVLESNLNGLKTIILSRVGSNGDDDSVINLHKGNVKNDVLQIRAKMYAVALVFQYMNTPAVAEVFVTVNARMLKQLTIIDGTAARGGFTPVLFHDGKTPSPENWSDVWQYWMGLFLLGKAWSMQEWMKDAMETLKGAMKDSGMNAAEARQFLQSVEDERSNGAFRDDALKFGDGYRPILSRVGA